MMGLRKDFSAHKNKTIEAFNIVSSDISTINLNLVTLRTTLSAMESRLSELNNGVGQLADSIRNLRADMELQNSTNASIASRIVDLNSFVNKRIADSENSIKKTGDKLDFKMKYSLKELASRTGSSERRMSGRMALLENKLKKTFADSTIMSKKVTAATNILKEMVPKSKAYDAKTIKLDSGIKESQEEIKKIKNLMGRKLRSARKSYGELESRLKSQKRRMQQLNRKIDAAAGRKSISGRARKTSRTATKTITKKITPKKTVTTIKTPKRKITKTVTKNKTVTKKETPKRKEVYEVIREKNPLI